MIYINEETRRMLAQLEGEEYPFDWVIAIRKQIESAAAKSGISFERAVSLIVNSLPRGV